MSSVRAATTLALWSAARYGGISPDSVLDALAGTGRSGVRADDHATADRLTLPGPGQATGSSADLLPLLLRDLPQLVLPRPGDLRGLPLGGALTLAGLETGAVVVFPAVQAAVVPQAGHWRVYTSEATAPPADDPAVATQVVQEAVRDATRLADLAGLPDSGGPVRDRIRSVMIAEEVDCPPGTPRRATGLLARVIALQALLAVAAGPEHRAAGTAAATSRQIGLLDEALAPLDRAVVLARRSAVADAVRVLSEAGRTDRRDPVR